MIITKFNALNTNTKYPISPYGDKTFTFENVKCNTLQDAYNLLVNEFVLNIPLCIEKPIRKRRTKQILKNYFCNKTDYVFIDIDGIKSQKQQTLIIQYFKHKNYECILGNSKTDFNIKGILKITECSPIDLKNVIYTINSDPDFPGTCDLTASGFGTYQAPLNKKEILYIGGSKPFDTSKIKHRPFRNTDLSVKEYLTINKTDKIILNESKDYLKFCVRKFYDLGYRAYKISDGIISFTHPSEKKSPGGFFIYTSTPHIMRHWNESRSINLDEILKNDEDYKYYKKQKTIQNSNNYIENFNGIDKEDSNNSDIVVVPKDRIKYVNERYLDVTSSIEDMIINFSLTSNSAFIIQSPMGTGKTNILRKIIEYAHNRGERILFLTNRISLANDIYEKYNTNSIKVKHYNGTDVEGNSYRIGDHLVCQVDSLYKYSLKHFDIVIFDEFTTTLSKLLSVTNLREVAFKLFSTINKKLVISDAIFVPEWLNEFVKDKQKYCIINEYRDDIELIRYESKDVFAQKMLETAKKQPITISSGSLTYLKTLEEMFKSNGISNVIVSSEIKKEVKERLIDTFKEKTPKYQVFMYTPSITVGISNENEVYEHFHYDPGGTMDIFASMQMMKRTRNAKKIHIYIKKPTTLRSVSLYGIEQKHDVVSQFYEFNEDGDFVDISRFGKIVAYIIKTLNAFRNLNVKGTHKLCEFQFKNEIKVDDTKLTGFLNHYIKLRKKKELMQKTQIFNDYKKLINRNPDNLMDITSKAYPNGIFEQKVKEFESIRYDPELFSISENDVLKLIEAELKRPGVIKSFKDLQKKNEIHDHISPKKYKELGKPRFYIKHNFRNFYVPCVTINL